MGKAKSLSSMETIAVVNHNNQAGDINSPTPQMPPRSLDELCSTCGNKIAYDVTGTGYCVMCGKRID